MDGHDSGYEEIERLRADVDAIGDAWSRVGEDPGGGSPVVAAQTKTVGTYPTAANRFYACQQVDVTGAEVEGGAGTTTAMGDTLSAYNLGSAIPPSGTPVVLTWVPYRWTFRYDG